MSSSALVKVKDAYSQVKSIASIFEKYGGSVPHDTPEAYLTYCRAKYENGRVPTDEEKAVFNEVRIAVDEQFSALCDVTMLQECHALSAAVSEENALKTKIADHERELSFFINGIFEEWSHFCDEQDEDNNGSDSNPAAVTSMYCGFDEVAEQEKADAARQEYDQWLADNEGKIHDAPEANLGGPKRAGDDESSEKKCTLPVGHFMKFSARTHPSTGLLSTIFIGIGDERVLKIARTVNPMDFEVREPGLCGGDGRTMTWYVQAVAGGSGHVHMESSWRGEGTDSSTTKIEVVNEV